MIAENHGGIEQVFILYWWHVYVGGEGWVPIIKKGLYAECVKHKDTIQFPTASKMLVSVTILTLGNTRAE